MTPAQGERVSETRSVVIRTNDGHKIPLTYTVERWPTGTRYGKPRTQWKMPRKAKKWLKKVRVTIEGEP